MNSLTRILQYILQKPLLLYGSIIGLPLLVYLPTLYYPFSPMDENWLIISRENYLNDWRNSWQCFFDAIQGILYRPVLTLTFIIDYHLWGLNPLGYHLTNLFLFGVLLFLLFHFFKLFQRSPSVAFVFTALVAFHPLLVQTAAWVPGRNDSLLAIFTLATFIQLHQFLTHKKVSAVLWHFLFFLLALFTKENAVGLPLLLVSLLFIIPNTLKKQHVIGLSLLWGLLTLIWVFMRQAAIQYTPSGELGISQHLLLFFKALFYNLGKLLIPFQQSVYPVPNLIGFVVGLIVSISLMVLLLKASFKDKKIAYLGLAILVTFLVLPVWYSSRTNTGEQYEHRLLVPLIGLFLFFSQIQFKKFEGLPVTAVCTLLLLSFGVKTYSRILVYRTELSYLKDGLNACTTYYFLYYLQGVALTKKGEIQQALNAFQTAIALYPKNSELLVRQANCYLLLNQKENCITAYQNALNLGGDTKNALLGLYQAYRHFGDSINAFNHYQYLKKEYPELLLTNTPEALADLYQTQLDEINRLIQLHPQSGILYVNRAKLLLNKKLGKQALNDLKTACDLEPNNLEFRQYFQELSQSFPH